MSDWDHIMDVGTFALVTITLAYLLWQMVRAGWLF